MTRELIEPDALFPAPGFSHVAVAEGGRFVFVAGQVALDEDFELIGGDDLAAQTVAAISNVGTALAAAGAGWDDVVRRTIYTLDPTRTAEIAAAIESVTGPGDQPPQTVLGVTGLALPSLLIEIEVTALVSA
ncbi:MAG: RidA family protein [Actinobacteria bacterium]|nr:RidA family protein [Actinomycetota bacterium]